MAHPQSQYSVFKLYQSVIDDVVNGMRESFLDEGVDEQVLQELRILWESKLISTKAVDTSQDNPAGQDGAAAGAGGGSNNSQGTNGHHAEKASHVSAPPTTSASHIQQPQPPSQTILPPELTNQVPIQITMPRLVSDPPGIERKLTIHVPASCIQTNKLQDILSLPAIQATLSLPTEMAAPALQAQINAALGLHPDFNLKPSQTGASKKGFIQTDSAAGGGDSSEDEDEITRTQNKRKFHLKEGITTNNSTFKKEISNKSQLKKRPKIMQVDGGGGVEDDDNNDDDNLKNNLVHLQMQKDFLLWFSTADSYEKVGFLKRQSEFLGKMEIGQARDIFANAAKKTINRCLEWRGPHRPADKSAKPRLPKPPRKYSESSTQTEDVFREAIPTTIQLSTESQSTQTCPIKEPVSEKAEPGSLEGVSRSVVPTVSRSPNNDPGIAKTPTPWWTNKDLVAYDAEHVHLKKTKDMAADMDRVKGGKIAVVDWELKSLYLADIYHAADTYLDIPMSGIGQKDLINGINMETVANEFYEKFKNSYVITVDGSTDFTCIGLKANSFLHFDLQWFYKRLSLDRTQVHGMSLRDIFFLEFGKECQGICSHSPLEDAQNTMKCFKAYTRRIKNKPKCDDKFYYEYFNDAVELKKMDMKLKFFCNTDNRFKSDETEKCKCSECFRLFYSNKRLYNQLLWKIKEKEKKQMKQQQQSFVLM